MTIVVLAALFVFAQAETIAANSAEVKNSVPVSAVTETNQSKSHQSFSGSEAEDLAISAVPIPEPSVYMLLGVGLLICGQRFLRSKSS